MQKGKKMLASFLAWNGMYNGAGGFFGRGNTG